MTPERATILVTPGLSQWSVREQGYGYQTPIAYFVQKEDAMRYATAFARGKEPALLQVLDERGRVLSEQRFEMEPEHQGSDRV
ncbi:MAG TPA: hypothetical protein VKD25_03855 [Burkholderiales bacterium]|nr:hypothetical protein [Burkholderiales bacterium]